MHIVIEGWASSVLQISCSNLHSTVSSSAEGLGRYSQHSAQHKTQIHKYQSAQSVVARSAHGLSWCSQLSAQHNTLYTKTNTHKCKNTNTQSTQSVVVHKEWSDISSVVHSIIHKYTNANTQYTHMQIHKYTKHKDWLDIPSPVHSIIHKDVFSLLHNSPPAPEYS